MKKSRNILLAAAASLSMLSACGDGNTFRVDGNIDGAGDSTHLVLEYSSNGTWVAVDSVTTEGKGEFEFRAPAPEYPNIYRVRHGADAIYFPVDSLDRLQITTVLSRFGVDYTLSGSDHAVQVMNIDKQARAFAASPVDSAKYNAWKHELAVNLLKEPSGIVAYYVINKTIGDRPVFDPLDNKDLKVIGAVANAFNTFRPNDPRTQYLVNVLLDGQRRRRNEENRHDTIQATEAKIINIRLQDVHGKMQDLEQVASGGKVVLLNYTIMTAEFSPALNKLLNDLYTQHKAKGFEIYQIALDGNEADWLTQARRLPWIAVRDPQGERSKNVTSYNVLGVPTTFIIGRNGEIVERVEDAALLPDAVAKYL